MQRFQAAVWSSDNPPSPLPASAPAPSIPIALGLLSAENVASAELNVCFYLILMNFNVNSNLRFGAFLSVYLEMLIVTHGRGDFVFLWIIYQNAK